MSSKRKFNRKSKYTLSQKIISAVTAAGFIMQPVVGFATSIHKADDAFKDTIVNNGNVTHIWADRVVDNAAINVFKDFNLSANDIANMYFNTKNPTGADKANLVNFVNSRIDINGTVNAVQNSQIGGNLFFLSQDGMAVGKSGVINTGSLYVMTPTQDYIKSMKVVAGTADAATAEKELNAITNITKDANAWQAIPVNTSGTITVLGKVNATNEVQMRAAKIGVGKNVDDSVVDNVAAGGIAAENAHIKTGITDFSNIVNINYKDESGNDVAVNSGITNLTATKTGSGDIVLEAYVDASNDKNKIEKLPVIGGTTLGTTAESVENTFTEQEFGASVDIYGEVNTTGKTGKVDISATAINSNANFDETLNDYKANNNDVAQLATVKADVNIGGTVKAADDVNIKAEAVNRYVDNTGGFAKALSVGISSGTPLTGDVAYSVLDTEANVNVASGANVASENGSVDIDAKAETLAASAASTTGLKFKAAGGLTGANVPATAVVYTGVENKANVTVEGDIKAGKDISIDADADMKVEADNKMSLKGKMANQFVVGVTVAGAENSASVDIKGSSNKVSADNDLSVNAKADSDFTSNTSIKAPEASAITVAVNVTDFNSNANVNVDTDLTAGNNLNVEADNTIVSDNVNAETKLGSNKYISAATQVVTTNAEGKITEVKNFINGLKTKLGFEAGGSDDIKTQLQLSEILKAGATVTYSGQKHKSGVNIGKNGSLTAQNGMLGVNAETLIEDAHIAATGTTYSYNDAYPAGATLNASVLVNNMDNSSSVVVADRDTASTEPALSGKTGVDVNASVSFEYNRVQNMIQDVEDAYNQIETATANLKGAIKTDFDNFLKDLKTQISNWESAFATADETLATSDSGVLSISEAATAGYNVLNALNDLNTMLDSTSGSEVADATKASIQGASDLLSSALAFIDPNSYGNFAASSASKGSSGNQSTVGGHIPSAINGAGTVIVNNVDTVSKVEIGSNTGIASYRDVNINAESFMKDVTLGGLNAMPITNSGGGTTASIGATVNYSDFNTDTVVAVNNGASITGGNINIAGSNVIDHVSVAGSAGVGPSGETQSGGIVLNGMLSFVNGSSDILTVVDDGASLTAKQNEYTETVKDEETGTDKETKKDTEGNISITGHNNSNIVNVAAGLNFSTGSGAVGVGLAYTDFAVKNIAGVADVAGQIKNLYSSKDDNGKVTVDNSKVDELDGELNNTYTASTASSDTKGSISAYGFNVDAATDGSIQSVSAAASANKNDDTGKESFFGKLKGKFSNVENKVFNKLDEKTGQIFGSDSGGADEMFNKGSSTHGTGGGIQLVGSTSGKGGFMPSFSIAGSGSVSLNSLNNATEAIVDNVNITMQPTSNKKGDISVTARDTLYAGAYSGAAALQWKKGGSSSDKAVGFAGAAGVNDIDNVVKAVVKNSTIENAGKFNTMALSGGEQLALGLGLALEKTGSTSGYSGNAAVSVNLIDHDVEALLENNIVNNADDINVAAYARDIENTGGGTLSAGQQKVGVGATVAVAQLNNNISAGIKGGSYTKVGNVDVDAMNALKNITVGIAAGATVSSGGDGASAVVEGAGVYNEVHNTTNAFIEGTDEKEVVISTVNTVSNDETGNVNVIAQDVGINNDYEKVLTNELTDGKEEIAERMGSGFDITGASELSGIETGDIEAQLNNKDAEGTGTQSNENSTEEVNLNKDSGSSIITVAGVLAGTSGKGAGGAAVAITDIENNYAANVEYADITADALAAEAGSDSNIVTVSGGIAAASKGSGVGSVTWNDVENTAKANIKDSVVNAQTTLAKAVNKAQIVSVAGQISGAGKAGVGATLSYIGLDNSTEANITSTTFDKRDKEETEGITVSADAENRSGSYNVAAGVSAAGTAAVSGNVAVTQTHGTSGAVIDDAAINNAKTVSANALDDTDILSVIGTVSAAGTASVGAGVAYTEIGSTSTDEVDAQQTVAAIENTDITTAASASGSTVSAQATDSSKVINVAVGIGGAGTAAVQGASATSLVNKTIAANITDTNIDENTKNSKNANVTIEAVNDTEITSSADVAAVAGTGAGVGAGVAVNRIKQNTQAALNGGTMNVNNLTVSADGTPRIENIGIGIGVAGEGAGVTGNVSVNMIENNVTAHIGDGANIVADGSVGVVATSDEQIANYAGSASVAGIGAGVGASVSVNQIAGTTSATVGDEGENEAETSVTAKGNDSLTTDTNIDKTTINDDLIDNDTVNINSHIKRTEDGETRSGLIVDASSTRDLKSFLINAGVGGVGAGVTGTVNVNMINGSTEAAIINTEVNSSANKGNVFVNAGDYTNMSGFVGSAGVAGVGGGVGLGSDTNTVTRKVSATVQDAAVYAGDFEVDADSMQGVSSFVVSAGVGGVGAGASGVVTVTKLNNTTKAALLNSTVNANTVNVNAAHTGIVNAGNVGVGASGLGGGLGISVGVLKDDSETTVTVGTEDSTATNDKTTITASGDVNIAAENTATVNPTISATGVGAVAGVAGATSINNINSKVTTNINNAEINSTGGNISGTAKNNFNVDAYIGGIAAAAVGVGASVTVNTIDSTVQTNVNNSKFNVAKDVTLTAEEARDIYQLATNVALGGVAAGANIAVTTVGQAITDEDVIAKIDEANAMYANSEGNDINSMLKGADDALGTAGITNYTPTIGAETGGAGSAITVNITGSDIDAGDNFNAEAKESGSIGMTLGGASGGAVAANAGVGILNVNRNVGVNISGGSINADKVDVGADITGEANLNVYQGSGGIIGANAAYAGVNTTGSSDINLNGVTIEGKNISIAAQDNAKTSLQAVGVAAGVAALGALAAEAANDSDVSVNMTGTTVTANEDKDDDESGKVEITTNKANTVTAQAVNTAGGAVAGAGMGATVTDTGSSTVGLTGNTMQADNKIDVNAKTNSTLKADVLSGSAGWFASGAVSIAEVSADTATAVTIGNGNTFAAQNINFAANSNITESMDMDALAISGYAALGGNSTTSEAYADATVTAEPGNTYKGSDNNAGNVSFNANNTVTQTADTSGISAAGLFATGTNIGTTTSDLKTEVNVKGSGEGSKVNNFNANASSYASVNNKVNGDGGAIADISPYAAKVDNNYTANTDVTIGGRWNTAGSFTAQAVNGMDIDLTSEAVRAAVIGGSGTWLDNTINNAANVTVNGATITTGGAQSYTAQNDIDYNGKIDGSGYGGINVNATDYSDDLDFTAGVDITGSTLHGAGDSGSITAFANTRGNITTKNSLKSAGVIPISLAFSDHAIDYRNSVDVESSELTTDKKDQNITLAATDDTDVKLETIADTQGGLAGAASAEASNEFNRSNKITVGSGTHLLSSNDANLYAGADLNGITSSLNLQVLADAYNKTALPVYTDPTVTNNMTQANQVVIASGTNVDSVRHANLKAGKGTTTVTKSAQEYNIYQGTGGSGTVTSTAFGEAIGGEVPDNYIEIDGNVNTGIHNSLNIDISGNIVMTDPVYNESGTAIVEDGKVDYSGIKADATETWFDDNTIKPSVATVENNLLTRYNEITDLLQQYQQGTTEYNSLKTEQTNLLNEMKNMGFATEINGKLVPVSEIEIPAIEIPDIVVSGGNINLETDTVKGGGKLDAQGAGNVNITNSSDAYLIVNDITMKDAGGQIKLNGSELTAESAGNELTMANVNSTAASSESPQITITGTTDGTSQGQPDIGVFGDITNTAGDVTIENKNHSITVLGNINARNINLIATNGDITQTSTEGLLNIGSDPVIKYQFSEDVAKKIQQYIYDQYAQKEGNYTIPEFKDYDDYIDWLKNNVGLSDTDLQVKEPEPGAGSIVAGGNVYISGLNVNIAGLVQSGYGDYSVTLDDTAKNVISQIDKNWQNNGKKVLTDAEVMSNDAYCINDGGEYFVSNIVDGVEKGVFNYEVKVYYNPSTGQLLTDTVEVSGGKVYITGNISSTGGGRIMAMDGTADININTSAIDKDVVVNTITNNDINGLVSITDKQLGQVTEYMNGQTRTYNIGKEVGLWQENGNGNYTYNVKDGLQYQWIGGVSGEVIKKYQYTEDFLFWGLLDYGKTDDFVANLKAEKKDIIETPVSSNDKNDKGNGVVITTGETGKDFSITGSYTKTDKEEYTEVTPDMQYDGFWGKVFGYGETTYTWTGTQGTASSTTTSIAADKDISIGFIGNGGKEKGQINVTTGKDMLIAGNISNAEVNGEGRGSVNLTSNSGSVSAVGNANINSDIVNIKAATGVNVNHSAIGNDADINIATNSGDIKLVSGKGDLNIVQAVTGGADPINAETGSVYLEAQGDILNAAATGNYAVKGQRIDLISHTGTIGTKDKVLTVLGGSELYSSDTLASSVNAQAQGDIVLTQVDNDNVAANGSSNMRLGTIVSEDGDAVLTVNDGSFVDAHPSENNDSSSAQDKIDRWTEAGLISDQDEADESTISAEQAKKERMEALDNQANSLAYEAIYDDVIKPEVEKYQEAADAFAKDETILAAQQKLQEALLEAGNDPDAIAAANAEYQQVVDSYFDGLDYKYDDTQKKFIANNDKAAATNYVFDKYKAGAVKKYQDAAGKLAEAFATNTDLQAAKDTYLNSYKEASAAYSAEIAAAEAAGATDKEIVAIGDKYQAKYDEITNEYLAAQKKVYGDNFTEAEQQLISSYAEVDVDESNYGWSKNQLLYAIQESVLTPDLGEVQTVETPNITANNITLKAASGGVGIDGEAEVIKYAELGEVESLKLLAQAKAGDLTWDADNQQVTIQQQQAITVNVKKQDGKVDVTGRDNVYLAGVDNTVLNIDGVTTEGDIRLQGDAGINVEGTLSGYDLTIAGGTGSIMGTGSDGDKYVDTAIRGTLDANAEGSIYISQNGDLKVLTVAAGEVADLKATNNILMSDVQGSMAQGHINAQTLNLTAGGNIGTNGTDVNAIRIADNGVVINAAANGDIVLAGVEGKDNAKNIVLGNINGASLDVDSVSSVSLGKDATEDEEAVEGSITVDGNVSLSSESGSITQATGNVITANEVNASATENILLGSEANKVNSFVVNGLGEGNSIDGNVDLVSSSDNGLKVNLNGITANGSVNVYNNAQTDLNISGGSVTTTGESAGDVTFTSEGNITADTTVDSAADIVMGADGAITNDGALTAQDNVNVKTTAGAINLGGSVTAKENDVNITTGSGTITTTGNVTSGTNVKVDAGTTGNIELGGIVKAQAGNVDVIANEGYIHTTGDVTANNNVNVDTANGYINLEGKVNAATGSVDVNTESGDVTTGGEVTGYTDVDINSGAGNVKVNGNVTATNNDVNVTSGSGAITTIGSISAGNDVTVDTKDGIVELGGNVTGQHDVAVNSNKGNVTVNGNITATVNDVNVTTGSGNITTTGAVTGGTNVKVNAGTTGNIELGGIVNAQAGNVDVIANEGYIHTTGDVTANNNVNVDTANGYINLEGKVNAATGSVDVDTQSGDVITKGEVTGNTDVTINSGAGNVAVGGNVTATVNNVNVTTGSGDITTIGVVTAGNNVNVDTEDGIVELGGDVTGQHDVTVNSNKGDVTVNGKVQSVTGSTNINAGTNDGISTDANGNVTVDGEIASGEEVIVTANYGNIKVTGTTTASNGNVETTVTGDGNINLNGSVDASGDVEATVTGEGDITTGENAEVGGTNIIFTTNVGDITTGSNLTAKENVDLNVNTGNITFGGDVNAGSENAVNGNITIDITNSGSIKDAADKNNSLTAIGPEGSETAGNIIITTGGAGDVDLYDLYATNAARIDIADGSLTLHEINGELVAMQLRTEGKNMNVENIVAGTQIVLTGSDMTLDQIAQRPDADGMLVITPDNAEADKPIDNFTIGDIKTNSDSGIRFDRLWVNNSDIHISEGQLWFDKLYVEDNAHFSNDEMTAAIYGKPPLRDGSDSVYWINTEENRPESSLDMWLNGTGDWMYLRFTDDHIQESNGILLTLDEYDYVYDQRFTAENHLRWQHGRYLDEDWKQAYGYGLSLHNRYGLIDYQEFTETNAGADEVAVEA